MDQRFKRLAVAVLIGLAVFMASPLQAAQDDNARWDQTFKGHEMWGKSLDQAVAVSSEENKPMLIDLFSPG